MLSLEDAFKDAPRGGADGYGDEDIPPIDSCVFCGQSSCHGECPDAPEVGASSGLFGRSLAVTMGVTEEFGCKLPDEPWSSLRFAFATESLAIASYALPLTATVLALDSSGAARLETLRTSVVAVVSLTTLMVMLHLLWGASLELGLWLSGRPSDASRSLSFSGYTCGFDLLTSPLGLAWLLSQPNLSVARVLRSAVSAPRPAMHAYLSDARELDASSIRAAERGALIGFALGILALVVGAAYGTWFILTSRLGL